MYHHKRYGGQVIRSDSQCAAAIVLQRGWPPLVVMVIALLMLLLGVTMWIWSVVLILTYVPHKQLITTGILPQASCASPAENT